MNLYRHIAAQATLEREYSPSSCVPDLAGILARYTVESESVRREFERSVVSYGDDPAEEFDVFFPHTARDRVARDGGTPAPALIYVHGGYWQELSKNEHSFLARTLNAHGIAYIAVNYGLAPEATLATMVTRCRHAVEHIVKHASSLGVDPHALHLAGGSAGAHLAAMTALADWPHQIESGASFRSLILMSGIFDLRPLPLTYVNDALGLSADDALLLSPLLRIDAAQGVWPRTLIVWGETETAEFKRQSREFADALARKGATVAAEEIAGRNHFDLIFDLAQKSTRFGALSLEYLRISEPAGNTTL